MSEPVSTINQVDSASNCWLADVFEFNNDGFTSEVFQLLVIEVSELIKHGDEIGFVPDSDHLGIASLRIEWAKWAKRVPDLSSRYITPNSYDISFNPRKGMGNRVVDVLIYKDPAFPFDQGQSSRLQGLKLLLFALSLLPKLDSRGLEIEKVANDFWRGIGQSELFPQLPLNFSDNSSLEDLANVCEKLIKDKYKQGGFRKFLTAIRNTVLVIQGWAIGNKDKKPGNVSSKNNKPRINKKPLSVRLSSYYSIDTPEEDAFDGEMIGFPGENGGEEGLLGVIEPRELSGVEWPKKFSEAITKSKSKYWLQLYHEAIPWSSRGINPLTRLQLVNWIKDNDTVESLLMALMLLTGNRYESVLELTIGENGDFTLDGHFTRHYTPPESAYSPPDEILSFMQNCTEVLRLRLPRLIHKRLTFHSKNNVDLNRLNDALSVETGATKKNIQKVIKRLIRKGANGLAIDRIPLALHKKISEITGDDAAGYILSSKGDEAAPVSSHYSAFEISDLEEIYRKAVMELFFDSNIGH